jgi:hypothetical protein
MKTGAIFSECMRYRYRLWRIWDDTKPLCCFVMLNPSTADEILNDPTVERCERRARMWGYGGLIVVNLFALRSTDPKALYRPMNPVDLENLSAIVKAADDSEIIVCAWGVHGKLQRQGLQTMNLLRRSYPDKVRVLKMNRDGSPAHPLYLPYSAMPISLEEKSLGRSA